MDDLWSLLVNYFRKNFIKKKVNVLIVFSISLKLSYFSVY